MRVMQCLSEVTKIALQSVGQYPLLCSATANQSLFMYRCLDVAMYLCGCAWVARCVRLRVDANGWSERLVQHRVLP
jgi:hypothetical protein